MNPSKTSPPPLAKWLLKRLLRYEYRYAVVGDFEEIYREILEEHDRRHALLWYWSQVFKSTPSFIANSFYWSVAMFKSYFKVALRNMQRQKLYSFLNISGLAIGIAFAIVIMLYIQNEFSYDGFHENSDRIYRVATENLSSSSSITKSPRSRFPIDRRTFDEIPEIEKVTRLLHSGLVTRYKDKQFGDAPHYVEPDFLEIFSFPLLRGDKETALREPNTAVVTEEFARKYFGDEDPMGKTLLLDNKRNITITGILKDIPDNSHIKPGFLIPLTTLKFTDPYISTVTYLLTKEGASAEDIEKKLPAFLEKHLGERWAKSYRYFLQPLTSIYLHSDLDLEYGAETGDITYCYILGLIAVIILLIACINFINLSTARSAVRAKEVGMRKVVGAHRIQLVKQFLSEFVLYSLIALVFALVFASLILPYFNSFLNKELSMDFRYNYLFYIGLFALTLFIGIVSGSYPAFFLSRYHPLQILKGDLKQSFTALFVRKGLVVFQFSLTVFFIIGTIVIFKQINYVKSKDLGFDAEQVVIVPIFKDRSLSARTDALKAEFLQHSTIRSVSACFAAPGWGSVLIDVVPEGFAENEKVGANNYPVDEDFFPVLGLKIVEGRNFSKEYPSDSLNAVIVNQTAVRTFGWDNPIGKTVKLPFEESPSIVVGVVEDFHFESMHNEIAPHIFQLIIKNRSVYVMLRINPDNIPATIEHIKNVWNQFSPDNVLHYEFLNETFDNMYRQDKRMQKIFLYASILAIFIACLGLFGLATFSAERRTKEIGIRKTLGSTVSAIVLLLSKDFLKLVLAANIIAWPIAYYIMNDWLENFAYRIRIGWWIFISAGILALVIALITISYQTIKAATANPIDSLRYE